MTSIYVSFSQQKFMPGTITCDVSKMVRYGDTLYIKSDFTEAVIVGKRGEEVMKLDFEKILMTQRTLESMRSPIRGRVNVYLKKNIFWTDRGERFIVVETRDVNSYLADGNKMRDKFDIDHVEFRGMRYTINEDNLFG